MRPIWAQHPPSPWGSTDLSEGKINRAELAVYGTQMDLGADHLEDSGREMCPATAEGFGLERVEELLPYRPASNNLELRRAALAALLRIGGDSFTLEAVNDTLAGCGINAKARETESPSYVTGGRTFPTYLAFQTGLTSSRSLLRKSYLVSWASSMCSGI